MSSHPSYIDFFMNKINPVLQSICSSDTFLFSPFIFFNALINSLLNQYLSNLDRVSFSEPSICKCPVHVANTKVLGFEQCTLYIIIQPPFRSGPSG